MTIHVTLDMMLVRRKTSSRELAAAIGLSETNLSLIKSGKVKGVRFATLDAICTYLECQPGDILSFEPEDTQGQ
ncbi:MAG: helix-turn-helix domain-containing protein [Sulfitobacter sp.]